jgi:hypothetical protein
MSVADPIYGSENVAHCTTHGRSSLALLAGASRDAGMRQKIARATGSPASRLHALFKSSAYEVFFGVAAAGDFFDTFLVAGFFVAPCFAMQSFISWDCHA